MVWRGDNAGAALLRVRFAGSPIATSSLQVANAGTPWLAYDQAAHLAAEERVVGEGVRYQYFNYPPTYLLLCALFAPLPYLLAFLLFESATLALYLVVATRIVGDRSAGAIVV